MESPKPMLEWHGVPLVQYQIDSLIKAGVHEVVVVLGHEHQLVAPYATGDGVQVVLNPAYKHGKTTSVLKGVLYVDRGATDLLLLAVDQPRPPEIIERVIGSHVSDNALITSPRYRGHGGHPLIFSAILRGELESITDEGQGVREVFDVHRGEVNEVEFDDPIVQLDVNTAEEYDAARVKYDA